ncbi:Nif3-like dinuclear metal center hexameric protein [Alkalihalobacillus sp. FSL W8-0930]
MSNAPTGHEVIRIFEEWSPPSLAVEGDRIGLMVGNLDNQVNRILTALDVTEAVLDEAIKERADFILAHHPLLFRPLKTIDLQTSHGRIIHKALSHGITIYAAHTNLDIARGGVNDMLSDALSLTNLEVLAETYAEELKKLVVYVPRTHADSLREALGEAGAGHIGAYSHCSYSSDGTGSFKPLKESNPYIGQSNVQEYVEETKIETIVRATQLTTVVDAMKKAHPYEEVAYDLYALEQKGETYGLGRIGELSKQMKLSELAEVVKKAFDVPTLRLIGDPNKKVSRVAVLGGDGNKYVQTAMRKGADVFITGDIYYHTAVDAIEDGFSLLDPGHNIEKVMKKGVAQKLNQLLAESGYTIESMPSEVNTDPYQYI